LRFSLEALQCAQKVRLTIKALRALHLSIFEQPNIYSLLIYTAQYFQFMNFSSTI